MTKISSFSKLENDLLPKFRESMSMAESTADARKFFAYTALELLNGALDGSLDLVYEDVELAPEAECGYVLSPRLSAHEPFDALTRESDLPAILKRFAATAVNRYRRLEKNPEKTESKIYHGMDGQTSR